MTHPSVAVPKALAIAACLCSSLAYADTPLTQPELRSAAVRIISQLQGSDGKAFVVLKDDVVYTAHIPREDVALLRLDSCHSSMWIGAENYSTILDAKVLSPGEGAYAAAAAQYHLQCLEASKNAAERGSKTLLWSVLGGLALILLL